MEENIKNNSPTVRYTLYAQCEIICNTVCLTKKCLIFGERKKQKSIKSGCKNICIMIFGWVENTHFLSSHIKMSNNFITYFHVGSYELRFFTIKIDR